ncbi:hypothetical protein [Streptomyces griseorubiginosus]|uniref:hypothetical protein n=1 Tax=Streptomyces griseorubiginosus TaxID=67304 RepID=UPI002E80A686|nr:hypothetical protein [Streptomyces griseorubiginosus]WUB44543.1 hypothetical protein OHN19_14840 [Streptomyces griseorubiginosus]WUB53061.1 hypothetical protein OG942_14835 [Streptomyces griseorubiginosus]
MNSVLVVVAAVVVGALSVLGTVQLATGWLPPWLRDTILRPRLSGFGTLLNAVGLGVFLFLGPLGSPPTQDVYVPLLGLALSLVGGSVLQRLAQRAPATKTSA